MFLLFLLLLVHSFLLPLLIKLSINDIKHNQYAVIKNKKLTLSFY